MGACPKAMPPHSSPTCPKPARQGGGTEQEPAAPLGRWELTPCPRAAVSVPLKATGGWPPSPGAKVVKGVVPSLRMPCPCLGSLRSLCPAHFHAGFTAPSRGRSTFMTTFGCFSHASRSRWIRGSPTNLNPSQRCRGTPATHPGPDLLHPLPPRATGEPAAQHSGEK